MSTLEAYEKKMKYQVRHCPKCGSKEFALEFDQERETTWVCCRNCDWCVGTLEE
jgi:hypothetical protein